MAIYQDWKKMSARKNITKSIEFAFRQSSGSNYTLEIYRPRTNALGFTKFIQVDNNNHPMSKKELKELAKFIDRFIAGPQC